MQREAGTFFPVSCLRWHSVCHQKTFLVVELLHHSFLSTPSNLSARPLYPTSTGPDHSNYIQHRPAILLTSNPPPSPSTHPRLMPRDPNPSTYNKNNNSNSKMGPPPKPHLPSPPPPSMHLPLLSFPPRSPSASTAAAAPNAPRT